MAKSGCDWLADRFSVQLEFSLQLANCELGELGRADYSVIGNDVRLKINLTAKN